MTLEKDYQDSANKKEDVSNLESVDNIDIKEEVVDIGDVPVVELSAGDKTQISREMKNTNLYETIEEDAIKKSKIIEEVPLSKEELEKEAAKLPSGSVHIYDSETSKKMNRRKSFMYCMTHDMQKEALLKKYGDPTTLSAKEKSHYEQELYSLSPLNQLKRTMQNRSLGIARYFLAFTEFSRTFIKKMQAKFTAFGEMLDEYAQGNSKEFIQSSNLDLEPKKKFLDEEIKYVNNYQDLKNNNRHQEAEEILKKRQIDRKDFAMQLLKGNNLSPEVQKMYNAYKELEGNKISADSLFNEVPPKTLYDNPTYLQNLNFLKTRFESIDRFEESIHNRQADAASYNESIGNLNSEYNQANKELLDELGFKPQKNSINNQNDIKPVEFLSTNEIDNAVEKNNLESASEEFEL